MFLSLEKASVGLCLSASLREITGKKKNEGRDLTRIHGRKNECMLLFCFLLLLVVLLQREQEGSETFLRINVCCLLCKRALSQAAPFSPLQQNYERTKVSKKKKSKTWVFFSFQETALISTK